MTLISSHWSVAHVLQIVGIYRKTHMLEPAWSPCSRFVPLCLGCNPSYLHILNTELETVVTFKDNQEPYVPGSPFPPTAGCFGTFACVWSPNSTLIASYSGRCPRRADLCWHPSGLHVDTQASAAHAEHLLGALSANEIVERLVWSPCGGLAALSITVQRDDDGCLVQPYPCTLYTMLPGQPLASMGVKGDEHGIITWSPSGDRLLVFDRFTSDLELVSSMCTSVLPFSCSWGTFSPCGRLLVVVGKTSLKLCRALDGSHIFSLSGHAMVGMHIRFTGIGDVLMVVTKAALRIVRFGQGTSLSTEFSQRVCSCLTAACELAEGLPHSCCDGS